MTTNTPDVSALQRQVTELRAQVEAQAKFMSFLSHDLRGSLNGVVLMLEVLKRELQDKPEFAESVEDLVLMRQSVLASVTTMERYLQADRLRRGRIPANPQPLQLVGLVSEVVGQYAEAARKRNVELAADVPDDCTVNADRSLLTMALQELLENAAKYAAPGPVRISAAPLPGQGGGPWSLSIRDSGPGIAPETLEKLIDPIRRAELKERGLGLVLAQLAVQRSGGRLEAESRPGGGSEFRLVLPALQPAEAGV